jgi:hypothetical protein
MAPCDRPEQKSSPIQSPVRQEIEREKESNTKKSKNEVVVIRRNQQKPQQPKTAFVVSFDKAKTALCTTL